MLRVSNRCFDLGVPLRRISKFRMPSENGCIDFWMPFLIPWVSPCFSNVAAFSSSNQSALDINFSSPLGSLHLRSSSCSPSFRPPSHQPHCPPFLSNGCHPDICYGRGRPFLYLPTGQLSSTYGATLENDLSVDMQTPDLSILDSTSSIRGSIGSEWSPPPADLHRTQCLLSGLSSAHLIQGGPPSWEPIARQHDPAFRRRSSQLPGRPARVSLEHHPTRSPFGGADGGRTLALPRSRLGVRSDLVLFEGARASIWTDRTSSVAACLHCH